jgi:hypothetical protein
MSISFPASPAVGQIYQGWIWTGSMWNPIGSSVTPISIQRFTANGTYTPSAGMVAAIIECIGGGGGSGGYSAAVGFSIYSAGGGSGAYARKFVTKQMVGASQTVTVGVGGYAGASAGGTGGTGGQTSVGSLCVASGGTGALGISSATANIGGGAGGQTGTGDVVIVGNQGSPGLYANGPLVYPGTFAMPGAMSGLNGAGAIGNGNTNVAANGAGYAGYAGIVIITEYGSSAPATVQSILGVVDGSSPAPGFVGELMTNSASGLAWGIGGAWSNVTSLNLTPGDWEITGSAMFTGTCQAWSVGLGTSSGALPNLVPQAAYSNVNMSSAINTNPSGIAPPGRLNISTATTVYLIAAALGGTAGTAAGQIQARRMR